ncbi:TonB-dependent receptor [Qipengyuania xiapuensis]|uniref:TonB-dependent receptor n=1 Tax=Qipengyuania xiapuensis TaxID=2867236 RepID=A0ABX8ZX30_9SPHN|nr:TonB-dependent receptor [Qipengyuania xiapuensis]QZD93474.1 TonB-dependent receptor [Qipengyuania xiapuensis]
MSQKTTGVAPFSRRIAALTTASGLALVAAQPAWAQDADTVDEPTAEEADDENIIIVSGFRESLRTAQDFKERADTVVDVITAEDIGALPDRSVAETLQRIPGVNIGRFEKTSDPTRFSVEGTGVIIRGLPYTRSELNGRDIFSANGGRVLSFEDVSPELVGRVEVYKNSTADMIEGHISGMVNLVTRKPLDNPGLNLAGSVEANYGDLREKWSPTFNILASDTFDSAAGTFGLQLSYSNSSLKSRTDASQIVDPCYRSNTDLTSGCVRAQVVNSGGFQGDILLGPDEFPVAGTGIVPQFANVRSTTLDRDREAISGVAQFESADGGLVMTLEYLRSETDFFTEEFAILGRIDDGVTSPVPRSGSTWTFDENGNFESGVLTFGEGDAYATPFGLGGVPTDTLRFLRGTNSVTQDLSFDVDMEFSDRFRGSFDMQYVNSKLTRDSVFGAMSTWSDIAIDLSGDIPDIQFLAPPGAPADYFSSGFYTYYWFGLDSREKNDGELFSLAGDFEYDISDDGFFKTAKFGARWAARDRINRNTNFSTWGNLSAPWAGRGGCAPWGEGPGCFSGPGPYVPDWAGFTPGRFYTGLPGQEFAIAGGAYVDEFPDASQFRSPFADNFQRGEAGTPIANGSAWFYGGDDFLGEYLSGVTDTQWDNISTFGQSPERFNLGVNGRTGCDIDGVYCPNEVSDVSEITKAAYARVDYGLDMAGGWTLAGNIGLRYVQTEVSNDSLVRFPDPEQFDAVANGGNGDGIVQPTEITDSCPPIPPGGGFAPDILYCQLTGARLDEYASLFTGEFVPDTSDITFDHFLPAFNIRLDSGTGWVIRGAVSKAISRPDLNLFNAGGTLGFSGNVDSGPLLSIRTGNRNLRPIESWNYDLSAEWYFDDVGSLTAAFFIKDIEGIVQNGLGLVNYTAPSGLSQDVIINGPANDINGTLKGFEVAYQQTYDFLPGLLSGLGSQFSYTYVDGGDFPNPNISSIGSPSVNSDGAPINAGPFVAQLPLAGISEHTVNATVFYEKGPLSARAAYNWRSEFVVTVRDDLFPFSPIYQESGGQLDASIFYSLTENIKLGVQGVNLLDEVTQLSTVVDYDGTRVNSAAFRNDRRYTFIARFNF